MTKSLAVSENARAERPAVILANLGTPQAPTARAVRPFLREFLSDRRIIEMPPAIWRPILEGIILRVRPARSAKLYESIWYTESNSSPLMYWSLRQRDELAARLDHVADVHLAMRYGEPSIRSVLDQLRDQGVQRVLIIPAYPQYASSSTAPVIDEVARDMLKARNQLEIRTIRSFHDAPVYIEALAAALVNHWDARGRPDFEGGDKLVLSFHSIPEAMHRDGDVYRDECETTAELLRSRLNLDPQWVLTRYQSVFGPAKWIGPATIDTMGELGAVGTTRVDVICPGFVADCIETLDEIARLNRDAFIEAGGSQFHYVPWGNDLPGCIDTFEEVARTGLAGWV
nr:ferrochelatase [Schaalia radingae]